MSASAARVLANQANAARSTGPTTSEGKANSRANSFKHGLTGDGVVVTDDDAFKIEQLTAELMNELRPTTPTGRMLVDRMAVFSVRMDRSVAQETAAIADHVRQAKANFEAPEGLDESTVAILRHEAGEIALFDPSKEASLARQYEAAAQRGFFRALNELRRQEKEARAAIASPEPNATQAAQAALGSFLQETEFARMIETLPVSSPRPTPSKSVQPVMIDDLTPQNHSFDLPIAIGRPR